MKRQTGFTLIELITVIVILGILSAFALPRFAGLEREARRASVQGLIGSIRSSSALAHALWMADGTNPATVTMEGQSIGLTFGYPSTATIINTLQDTTGFTQSPAGTFYPTGVTTSANCRIVYAQPAAVGGQPTITPTVTNCS